MAFNHITPGLGVTVEFMTEGGSFSAVGQLKDVDGTSSEVGMFDSTGVGSQYGEQVPTIFKGGDFGFKVFLDWSNASHAALFAAHKAKTLLYWRVSYLAPIGPQADGDPWSMTFAGYIKSFGTSGYEAEGGIEGAISVAVTGEVSVSD